MEPDPLLLPVQKLEFDCTADRPVAFWPWDSTAEPLEARIARALGAPLPGRVFCRVLDDYDDCPRAEFRLEVTLWGRRAVAAADAIRAAVRRLGEELHDPSPFTCQERPRASALTLGEHAEDLPRRARRFCLSVETPLDIDGEPPFDFKALVVDAARRLAAFDLEDREDALSIDREGHWEYERPNPEAWPWLLALAPGRSGRRTDEGFGVFSFWVEAGP